MSGLHINAEFYGGTSIETAAREIIRLATRIGVSVHAPFNGVTLRARPGDNAKELVASWNEEMKSDLPYRIASDRTSRT